MSGVDETAAPISVEDVTGLWLLRVKGGPGTCRISLGRFATIDGFGVQVEHCAVSIFQHLRNWRLGTVGFELLAYNGVVTAAFRKASIDEFISDDGLYSLERTPLA